jgi:hypothetical protein
VSRSFSKQNNILKSDISLFSGVAGGVVQSRYFQIKFGLRPAEGFANQNHIDNVSANVVSVLQGGAFFGALSSAPISGRSLFFPRVLASPSAGEMTPLFFSNEVSG